MIDLGTIKPGSTFDIPFSSFAAATGAPSAATGLAVGDILVYKDGSTTERGSASGFTLLDTDGLDFDGKTGINAVSIDLSDNTTAGFWAAGSRYFVVVDDITIDSQTVRFVAARFRIGLPGATLNTTIATLASQTSFTLTVGPAEDDALNGCPVYIHDVASAVQGGFAVVLDYTGSTKTVTLAAGTTFTVAATDNIMVFPPGNAHWHAETAQAPGSIPNAVAGASGGLMISGSNAGTTTLGALTVTGATTLTGAVTGTSGSNDLRVNGAVAGASGGLLISGSNAGTTTLGALTVTGATTLTGAVTGTNASNDVRLGTTERGLIRDKVAERTTLRGTVGSASSTTGIVTSAISPATSVADQVKGRIVIFDQDTTTAALRGQATDITASSASATPTLTVTALTTAPASGDTFTVV